MTNANWIRERMTGSRAMAAYRRTLFAAGAGVARKSAEMLDVTTARQTRTHVDCSGNDLADRSRIVEGPDAANGCTAHTDDRANRCADLREKHRGVARRRRKLMSYFFSESPTISGPLQSYAARQHRVDLGAIAISRQFDEGARPACCRNDERKMICV
jgi:hypothetical protein